MELPEGLSGVVAFLAGDGVAGHWVEVNQDYHIGRC